MALERALAKAVVSAADLGLVEIKDAFASVAVHATRAAALDAVVLRRPRGV